MKNKPEKIQKDQKGEAYLSVDDVRRVVEVSPLVDKINEIIDYLPDQEKYPLKEGQKEMWAILGVGGAIYGFASSSSNAIRVRDKAWNIGNRKPEKYIVNFKKVETLNDQPA